MNGHTPGPWELPCFVNTECPCAEVKGPLGYEICEIIMARGITDEDIANARLIASAPDLLALLESAVRSYALSPDLHDRALAAIAKATQP